ncbi:hypothetical protein Tco_1268480 [Tanacetum coccineum]
MYLRFLQIILDIHTEHKGKYLALTLTKKLFANTKRGYAGDIIPLLPAMLVGVAMDQGEGSAQPAEIPSHTSPLPEGNTSESAEDSMQLKELMDIVPKVKLMEKALKRKTQKVVISESEGEEPEDQGRIIQDIDDDPLVSLVRESMKIKEKSIDFVTPTKYSREAQEEDISPTILEAAKRLSKVASQGVSKVKSTNKGKRYRRRARSVAKIINIGLDAEEEINTGIEEVSTGSAKVDSGTASKRGQREGKAPMVEKDIQATHKTKE